MSENPHSHYTEDERILVSLTHSPLDVSEVVSSVKSPKAGAIVFFAGTIQMMLSLCSTEPLSLGTTRDNFEGKAVTHLEYTSYPPLALKTMVSIAQLVKKKYDLTAVSMIHRLGVVPVEEESILIAVSAPHRNAAWRAGEEALEVCKTKLEVWKLEEFEGDDEGVWRANRDEATGIQDISRKSE